MISIKAKGNAAFAYSKHPFCFVRGNRSRKCDFFDEKLLSKRIIQLINWPKLTGCQKDGFKIDKKSTCSFLGIGGLH